jgi:hypothetical protein
VVIDVLHSPLGVVAGFLVGVLVAGVIALPVLWWCTYRERRRGQREAERRQQLWEVKDQLWRDSLPDWQREAIDAADRQRGAIQQEARRRLGLPEKDA